MKTTQTSIELLESRIAPAKIVGQVLSYTDLDGDKVTVTISGLAIFPGNFAFDTGFLPDDTTTPQQLQRIDLDLGGILDAEDANIATKVTRAGNGDGLVNIGYIVATDDLGSVTIAGDLGKIIAGDADAKPGLKSLSVRSMGLYGTATQEAGGNLLSTISMGVGSIKVTGDVKDVAVQTTGKLGSLTIGGSLIGGGGTNSGRFQAESFGAVKIGRDIVGGDGDDSGEILCDDGDSSGIASLSVGGSIYGGSGARSGSVTVYTTLWPTKIVGSLVGGDGGASGSIIAPSQPNGVASIVSVTIGGSMIGSVGGSSGSIYATGGPAGTATIGKVKVGHDVLGGEGNGSGAIYAKNSAGDVTIGGSLAGGDGFTSARIFCESSLGGIGAVKIGRDVLGGSGTESGRIVTPGTIANITVGGFMMGGDGNDSGNVVGTKDVGAVKIGRDVIGGSGTSSGQVFSGAVLTSVTIGGSLFGGDGVSSGSIRGVASLGPIKIGGAVQGGEGNDSARISTDGPLTSFTAGGSVVGNGPGSGQVISGGNMGAVKIGGDLRGGSISESEGNLSFTGYIQGQRIASVFIGGSIVAGIDSSDTGAIGLSASIRAFDDIGAIVVKGSLLGNATPDGVSSVIISARGQATLAPNADIDVAIKSLAVGGRVEFAKVLAGFDPNDSESLGTNGSASIGAVKVGGNWTASSIAAGVEDGSADGFGINDHRILAGTLVSRIASITIKGVVAGTASPTPDHFGFVADQIGSFKAAGFTASLDPDTAHEIIQLSPLTADATLRES